MTSETKGSPRAPSADTAAAAPRGSGTLEGLERALDVLTLFAKPGTTSLGITEISRELNVPKAVVHRIVTTLCSRDFIRLDPTIRRYSLGPAWLVMSSTYTRSIAVLDLAREAMRRLSDRTSETSTLSVRHGNHRVYVDQVTPRRDVIMSVEVGARFPLHAGSSSKAFLAFMDSEEQEDYIESIDLEPLTGRTIVDRTELLADLRLIRDRGYAASFGERQAGAGAVAAPLLDFEDKPVAVISVCGPAERIQKHVDELATELLAETTAISARLGHISSR